MSDEYCLQLADEVQSGGEVSRPLKLSSDRERCAPACRPVQSGGEVSRPLKLKTLIEQQTAAYVQSGGEVSRPLKPFHAFAFAALAMGCSRAEK